MAMTKAISFQFHDASFSKIVGEPTIKLLVEDKVALFHEACIYHQPSNSVFVTSNQIDKSVVLTRIYDGPETKVEDVTPATLKTSMLNGGVNYGASSILLCTQTEPAGLVEMHIPDGRTRTVLSSFYSRPFNSVNDVVVHTDGTIWFTDPCYGHHQGFRPKPELPNQVYRFDPKDKSVRAVADGFVRCNGLCFSPDYRILYVTDTGAIHGSPDVPIDHSGPSHIYAFDVLNGFLVNRRLFAYADGGWPDGIKCDEEGNIFAGCGDGIEVWNPYGVLIGRILVEGGVSNFCFGENGTIYMCNETRFWKVDLNRKVRGALLKL